MSRSIHNTLNKLKVEFKSIYTQIVLLLENKGFVNLSTTFVNETKIEDNANRYTFVWRRDIEKHKTRIEEHLEKLWNYTEEMLKNELQYPIKSRL
jgi:hypothetical protein